MDMLTANKSGSLGGFEEGVEVESSVSNTRSIQAGNVEVKKKKEQRGYLIRPVDNNKNN